MTNIIPTRHNSRSENASITFPFTPCYNIVKDRKELFYGFGYRFFLVPFLSLFVIFGTVFGAITGTDRTKIELPYDEERGYVWTSSETSEWFNVTDTDIKNGKAEIKKETRQYYNGKEWTGEKPEKLYDFS